MRTRIADEIARTDLTTQINRAIQSAIKHHERERFYFNSSVTDTLATVSGQEYYGAAANARIPNIVTIDAARITIDGSDYPLEPVPFEVIDAWQTQQATGDPDYYAYYAQQLRFYPEPNAVRTVTFAWVYRFAALVADTDTNAWMTDGEELIRSRAKLDLILNVMKEPTASDDAQAAQLFISDAYAILKRETRLRRSSGRLRTDVPQMRETFDIAGG